jgi:predicted NBD/HSP70 family sugar kinase
MKMQGRGSNSARVRLFNERVLLTQLRRLGQATQKELALSAGLTVPAVVDIVEKLVGEKLVQPIGKRTGRVGQPSMLYSINPDGVFACGLRAGEMSSELVLVDFAGLIRARRSREMQPRLDEVSAFLKEGIEDFYKSDDTIRGRLTGLGIGLSHGLWYRSDRQALPAEIAAPWNDTDLGAHFQQLTDLPAFVENDIRLAAIAEYLLGEAQDFENFLYLSIGGTISGALVLGGNLLAGAQGGGATLGAIPVGPSRLTHLAAKGARRLEERASLDGLVRHLGLHGFTIRAVSELPDVIDEARGLIQEWLDDCIGALVEGLTACFAVVPVETVIIDSVLPKFLALEITERLGRRLQTEAFPSAMVPRLMASRLGADAALIGSAILPINAHFFPTSDLLVGINLSQRKGGAPQGSARPQAPKGRTTRKGR